MNTSAQVSDLGKVLRSERVHFNLHAPALVECAVRRGEVRLDARGAVVGYTAPHTGRSPKDKFIVRVQLAAPPSSDSLAVAKHVADPIWSEMNRRVGKLVTGRLSENDYASLANLDGAPQGFTNLMSIVVADAARRHGNPRAAHAAASVCTNPQLLFLWDRWAEWKKAPRPELGLKLDSRKQMAGGCEESRY